MRTFKRRIPLHSPMSDNPYTDMLEARLESLLASLRCFWIVKLLSFALRVQRCSWRCHGCQHRSPRSTQDGTHSRWPCPWHPGVRQGTGQVSPRPVHGSYFFFASHMYHWWHFGSLYWVLMRKPAIVTQFLSEMKHIWLPHLAIYFTPALDWPGSPVFLCRRQAHLCALAANCDEPMYVKLVEALCAEHQINLIKVKQRTHPLCEATCWCAFRAFV